MEVQMVKKYEGLRMDQVITFKGKLKLNVDDIYQLNYILEDAEIIEEPEEEETVEDEPLTAEAEVDEEREAIRERRRKEKLERKLGIKVIRNISLQDAIKLLKKNK